MLLCGACQKNNGKDQDTRTDMKTVFYEVPEDHTWVSCTAAALSLFVHLVSTQDVKDTFLFLHY